MYRVQKILSMLGIMSRRKSEYSISKGLIKINNSVAMLGSKVKIGDIITFNKKDYLVSNKIFNYEVKMILYNKPVNEIVSTTDTHQRKTVFDSLPNVDGKWINIGRLDYLTSGLLLFCNNGDLANLIMHPSSNIKRVYEVFVNGALNSSKISECKNGVDIGKSEIGKLTDYKIIDDNKVIVSLYTGKNREVRRIFDYIGNKVLKLKRIQYGNIKLSNLREGEYRFLSSNEINKFKLLLKN